MTVETEETIRCPFSGHVLPKWATACECGAEKKLHYSGVRFLVHAAGGIASGYLAANIGFAMFSVMGGLIGAIGGFIAFIIVYERVFPMQKKWFR